MAGALKPLGKAFHPLIARVARELAAPLEPDAVERLAAWLDLLAVWNAKVDLTAARGTDELVDLMIADALVLARLEQPGARVVDVGSGAGGPGLALALVRPDLAVTLVEPLQKRVAFLRTVAGHVLPVAGATGSLQVLRARGEELLVARAHGTTGSEFASAMARATLAPSAWLELGARLAPHGVVSVLLAREAPPELIGWRQVHDESYQWPLTGAERRIVRYQPE